MAQEYTTTMNADSSSANVETTSYPVTTLLEQLHEPVNLTTTEYDYNSVEITEKVAANKEDEEDEILVRTVESFEYISESIVVTPSNMTSLLVCRICHGNDSYENYLSPCKCKGTLSKVHRTCLEHWLAESDTSYCELCGHEYITERVPQYGLVPSIFKWLTCADSWRDIRDLLVDLVVMCIFTPMVVLGTYAGIVTTENLYRVELITSSIQIPMTPTRLISLTLVFFTATMDLVYTSWMVVRFQHHVAQWHQWWRRKCVVRLVIDKNDKRVTCEAQDEEPIRNFD